MGLTFELTPRAEAGTVSRGGDDGSAGAGLAYSARRSVSGLSLGFCVTWRAQPVWTRPLDCSASPRRQNPGPCSAAPDRALCRVGR